MASDPGDARGGTEGAAADAKEETEDDGGWWGMGSSWIQNAKDKSTNMLEFMKRDLTEFATVVQHSSASAVSSTATSVKEKLNTENSAAATAMVKDKLSNVLGAVASTFYIPPDDSGDVPVFVSRKQSRNPDQNIPFVDRAKSRLYALQTDAATYMTAIADNDQADYEKWLPSFSETDRRGEISELIASNNHIRAIFTQIVPTSLSYEEFWRRYFFRVHRLDEDERRKAALKERAEQSEQDEGLGWGDEDDWNIVEVGKSADVGEGTSKASAEDLVASDAALTAELAQVQRDMERDARIEEDKDVRYTPPPPPAAGQDHVAQPPPAVGQDHVAQPPPAAGQDHVAQPPPAPKPDNRLPPSSQHPVPSKQEQDKPQGGKENADVPEKEEEKEVASHEKGDLVVVGTAVDSSDSSNKDSGSSPADTDEWEQDFEDAADHETNERQEGGAADKTEKCPMPSQDKDADNWEDWE